jgi:hypothetical protein
MRLFSERLRRLVALRFCHFCDVEKSCFSIPAVANKQTSQIGVRRVSFLATMIAARDGWLIDALSDATTRATGPYIILSTEAVHIRR